MIVRWSPLAIDRVVEIGEWIATERPAAAVRIVDGLFDAAERLEVFPLSGRRVPEFDERTDLREIFFEQFRIVYKVSETRVDCAESRGRSPGSRSTLRNPCRSRRSRSART